MHTWPQAPQLEVSVLVSTHEVPHAVLLQAAPQMPSWQTLPIAQVLPQAPQFCASVSVSTQSLPHLV
jgi:hypothetical protein